MAGVLLYHLDLPLFRGGFLGVDVFFVLSGFLITALLVEEFAATGSVHIPGFYLRRFRRLVPAVAALIVAVVIAARFFFQDAAPRVKTDALASLVYVTNWWFIVAKQSYFQAIGRPALLQHLWSLAIEEQFYLVWPLALVWCLKRSGRTRLTLVAAALAAASAAWMAFLALVNGYPERADPSRIYFGTDTHCTGLLVGAALAGVWRPWQLPPSPSTRHNVVMSVTGVVALLFLVAAYTTVGEQIPFLYRGGFLLLSLAAAMLVVAATYRGTVFSRVLGTQPLRWMGERSYGLYLWHWPVFVVTRPGLDVLALHNSSANAMFRLGLTVALTELSYRYVERPIRGGAIGRFVTTWRHADVASRRALARRAAAVAVPTLASVVLACGALLTIPNADETAVMASDVAEAMGIRNGGPTRVEVTDSSLDIALPLANAAPKESNLPPARFMARGDGGLTALGDSVLLGTRFYLESTIRAARTDAEVGRQADGLVERIHALRSDELLAPTVLLHVGTNGYITERQLRQALNLLSDRRRVILVNARAPKRWMEPNNELIAKVAPDYRNTVLADWAAVSEDHPEFLASDGVHLTPAGQRAFVDEIIHAGGFERVTPPTLPARDTRAPTRPSEPVHYGQQGPKASLATNLRFLHTGKIRPFVAPSREMTTLLTRLGPLSLAQRTYRPVVRYPSPMPLDSFWHAMAQCETGSNWTRTGRFSGGLGIYVGTWKAWSGAEFAPTPAEAAQEQQILVANRISTQGWRRPDGTMVRAVGFSGWGCINVVGAPELLTFVPETVIAQAFSWRQTGELVRDLQSILAADRNGIYGPETWALHRRALKALQLPASLAPPADSQHVAVH